MNYSKEEIKITLDEGEETTPRPNLKSIPEYFENDDNYRAFISDIIIDQESQSLSRYQSPS